MTTPTNRLEAIEARLKAATPGEWELSRFINEDGTTPTAREELAEILRQSVTKSEGGGLELFGICGKDEKGVLVVCYTGNGPRSLPNADLLSSAPADLAWAVARIRELDAAIVDAAFHLEAHAKGYCELTKRDASIILASLRKAKNLKGDE